MARYHIRPSQLKGALAVPPSKSHTMRAILFGALGHGVSLIRNVLASPDTAAMIHAIQLIGAHIEIGNDGVAIHGTGGKIHSPDDVIPCGNSGQVLRFIGALCALQNNYAILTGDISIRHSRPMQPLLDGLTQLGAFATSSRHDGYAPIIVKGPLKVGHAKINGEDSQPVSGLLIAGAFADHPIQLTVSHPGEKPWIGLTLYWFDKLGIPCRHRDFTHYEMKGKASYKAFQIHVPGDFSSAAFPIVAAIITGSELTLRNLDPKDPQGDKAVIDVLIQMGARIEWEGTNLHIRKSHHFKGTRIDVNDIIDAVPILAVAGCFAEGKTEIVNAAIARKKECDRLRCIAHELKKMGAQIEEKPDGLVIHRSDLKGAHLETYHDHRMVLALSVAALAAKGESSLVGVECAAKTYPTFHDDFRAVGAHIDVLV